MELLNPFEELSKSLLRIENRLIEIKELKTEPVPLVEYLTRKETSKLLSISLPTLNDWTKKGYIPAYRIGASVRYLKEDVINSLKKVQTSKYKRG